MKKLLFVALFIPLSACGTDGADYIVNKTAFCTDIDGNKPIQEQKIVCKDAANNDVSGRLVQYYDDGKKKTDFITKDGLPYGEFKYFYTNKNLAAIYTFKNGKLDGFQRDYYEDGSIKTEYKYTDGIQDGSQKKYDKDGKLSEIKKYKNGKTVKISEDEAIQMYEECKELANECPYVYIETERTKGCRERRGGRVFGITKEGVLISEYQGDIPYALYQSAYGERIAYKPGNYETWFLYTDKQYVIDDGYKRIAYYVEYVGTYEYTATDKSRKRVHAYKETNIPVCKKDRFIFLAEMGRRFPAQQD